MGTSMLSKEVLAAIGNVGVVGTGTMGKYFVDNLLQAGVLPSHIGIYDHVVAQQQACLSKYHAVRPHESLKDLCQFVGTGGVMVNCTNTVHHLATLQAIAAHGCRHIFSEKPLVLAEDLPKLGTTLDNCIVGCGYLINFSDAVKHLVQHIEVRGLHILEIDVRWGKNRTIEQPRASAGTLEDEATHPIALILALMFVSSCIVEMAVRASLLELPFVDHDVQLQAARGGLEGYAVSPVSTADIILSMKDIHARQVQASVHSSFTNDVQERSVLVKLGTKDGELTTWARLNFDVCKTHDVLTIGDYWRASQPQEFRFPSGNKILAELEAFLRFVACPEDGIDPRTIFLAEALTMVRISAAAAQSSQDNGTAVSIAWK